MLYLCSKWYGSLQNSISVFLIHIFQVLFILKYTKVEHLWQITCIEADTDVVDEDDSDLCERWTPQANIESIKMTISISNHLNFLEIFSKKLLIIDFRINQIVYNILT